MAIEEAMMHHHRRKRFRTITMLAALALGSTTSAASAVGASGGGPEIRPDDFVAQIDNPYLPLVPGSRWVYEGRTSDGVERTVVEVTGETRRILGVDTTVVRDTVYLDGEIIEDTFDWLAQDQRGNVWYFGEDTHEYEDGVPVNAKGAWEAGVDGARPGIVMRAHPRRGQRYRQELSKGVAEDMAKVLSVDASARVPFGTFEGDVVKTKDFTPLEPGVVEHKFYAPGIGLVLEVAVSSDGERVELIERTAP